MKRLNAWVNSFVPAFAFADAETFRLHRLFVIISFITTFFAIAYCLMSVYIEGYNFVLAMSICALVFVLLPFLLQQGVRLSILSNVLIASIAIPYSMLIYWDGGIRTANVTPWIIILPAIAMMTQGSKTALAWLFISFGIIISYSVFTFRGVHFHVLFDSSKDPVFSLLSLLGVATIAFAIMYVFEKEKSEALNKLEAKNIALRELDQEKNNFLAIVAHDLKNPLASVRNFAEVSAHPQTTEEKRQQYLQNIAKTTDRMFELVKNLLDVNQIESGKISLRPSRINLNELVKEQVIQIQQLASIRRIHIMPELPATPIYLHTDVRRLEQVLENYTSNALKYSPPDTTLHIRITGETSFIEIAVRDEGEGISAADLDKLFKPFGVTTAIPREGEHKLGLGLAIVRKIGDELQAETGCRSQPGKGSEFYIRFTNPVTG